MSSVSYRHLQKKNSGRILGRNCWNLQWKKQKIFRCHWNVSMWCGGEYFWKNFWRNCWNLQWKKQKIFRRHWNVGMCSGRRLLEEFLEGAAEIFHWRIRKPSDVIGLLRPGLLKVCLSLIQFYLFPCMSYPEKCKILLQEKQKSSCATDFFFPCFPKVYFYWTWVYPLLRMYYQEIYWLIPLKKQRIFHFHWIPQAREKKTNNDDADFVCSIWTEEERLYDGNHQNITY